MAIATALPGFNDLGHSMTLLFSPETDFINKDLYIAKKWTKPERGKLKKNLRFLSTANPSILWLQGAWKYGR